jgi:hypothetical protein
MPAHIMTNNSKPAFPIEILLLIIVTLTGICITLILVGPELLPQILKPTPGANPPASVTPRPYQPEVIPALTDTPNLIPTSTIPPTNTPIPTLTPKRTPTITITGPLPDLTVTGISDPICTQNHVGTETGNFLNFTIYIRNIGRVATRSFGPFDVTIALMIGQTSYGLEEWTSRFNGVAGTSKLKISNLNPNADVALKLEINLRGNRNFGIQATANSGANTIPESNTTNNTRTEYFSIFCY